ncbi:hypothetical protein ElyMa_005501200 [Elysia marginata]|uniref:Uncharacterized protein n=1 Tax=Elysia marginata TaxID=1093978 RepID=A0AAV4EVQ9_9GAST|nr:hypothetical protein ElyMa_005501200 [Elysia marginata]
MEELNLVSANRGDEEFRLSCGMLDDIAFLPLADVRDGKNHLSQNASDEMKPLIIYFDQICLVKTCRSAALSVHSNLVPSGDIGLILIFKTS